MPALNFQTQFADAVESGAKCQTIRQISDKPRAPKWRVGDTAYLYTGLRTKSARKLGEGRVILVEDFKVARDHTIRRALDRPMITPVVHYESYALEQVAKKDGFEDWPSMRDWFDAQYSLPFTGQLIIWDLLPKSKWTKPGGTHEA